MLAVMLIIANQRSTPAGAKVKHLYYILTSDSILDVKKIEYPPPPRKVVICDNKYCIRIMTI